MLRNDCLASLIRQSFEFFWFTQTTFFVHQKNSKDCLIREAKQSLLSNEMVQFHSSLLNISGLQCKTAENHQKCMRTELLSSPACANPFSFPFLTKTYHFLLKINDRDYGKKPVNFWACYSCGLVNLINSFTKVHQKSYSMRWRPRFKWEMRS